MYEKVENQLRISFVFVTSQDECLFSVVMTNWMERFVYSEEQALVAYNSSFRTGGIQCVVGTYCILERIGILYGNTASK